MDPVSVAVQSEKSVPHKTAAWALSGFSLARTIEQG